jgi:hypothetical protein
MPGAEGGVVEVSRGAAGLALVGRDAPEREAAALFEELLGRVASPAAGAPAGTVDDLGS